MNTAWVFRTVTKHKLLGWINDLTNAPYSRNMKSKLSIPRKGSAISVVRVLL